MDRLTRRRALRLSGCVGTAGLAGCTNLVGGREDETHHPDPSATPSDGRQCDEYVYRNDGEQTSGELPWDLRIRNVSLSTYPVSVTVTDRSRETPTEVVSCAATSEAHATLAFDLSPDAEYEVHVTLDRPRNPEEATTTISGDLGPNEALEVTVEDGTFQIRHVHADPASPAGTTRTTPGTETN